MANDESDLDTHGIERVIRRAATDPEFRDYFLDNPVGVAETLPIPFTDTELAVLDATPRSALEAAIDEVANNPARLREPLPETYAPPRVNCGGILPDIPQPGLGLGPSPDSWLPDDVANLDRAAVRAELGDLAEAVAGAPVPEHPVVRRAIGENISALDDLFARGVEQLTSAPLASYEELEPHLLELEAIRDLSRAGSEPGIAERIAAARRAFLLLTRLVVLEG
jgi:hypothetical protein